MPNKYSHAYVLSHYEAQGLIHFDGPRVAPPRSQHLASLQKQSRADHGSTPQHPFLSTGRPSSLTERICLRSASPLPLSSHEKYASPPHQRTETNNTTLTQIYSPVHVPLPTEEIKKHGQRSHNRDELASARQQLNPLPAGHNESRKRAEKNVQNTSGTLSHRTVVRADDRTHAKLEGHDARTLHSPRPLYSTQRRQSNETAIFLPNTPSNAPPMVERQLLAEASGYLRNPPSPPLTPENRQSFSLDTSLDSIPPRSTTTAAESSSSQASDPRLGCSQTNSPSISLSTKPSTLPQLSLDTSRLEISTGATLRHSTCPLQNSTRNSSYRVIASPDFDPSNCRASSSSTKIPPSWENLLPTEDTRILAEPFFLADLETLPRFSVELGGANLPTELSSDVDDDVLPWEKVEYSDATPTDVYRPWSLSAPTRASSFDSAAPPPIGLSCFNGPLPSRSRPRQPPEVPTSNTSKLQKLTGKSFFSIFHTQSHNPVSVSPQTIISDQPSTRASVYRTSAPSIPVMFQTSKSPWPHETTLVTAANPPKAAGVSASPVKGTSSNVISPVAPGGTTKKIAAPTPPDAVAPPNTTFRQNGPAPKVLVRGPLEALGDRLPPFTQAAPFSRGKSVGSPVAGSRRPRTAAAETTQKRKSWFNTDTLDRTFCGREARKRERKSSEIAPGLM